jgi:DNA-directed RNA polymerase specialized sigma24 family protein
LLLGTDPTGNGIGHGVDLRCSDYGAKRSRQPIGELEIESAPPSEDVLALDEALTKVADQDPMKAQLLNLRYFAGLSVKDAANTLGISRATADRHGHYAKVWLYCALQRTE